MKKIFTMILVAAGTISFASAQSNNSVAFNGHKSMNDHSRHAVVVKTKSATHHDAYFSDKGKDVKAQKTVGAFHQKNAFAQKNLHHKTNNMSSMKLQHVVIYHKADGKMYGHKSHK